jgi:hypothetical protein
MEGEYVVTVKVGVRFLLTEGGATEYVRRRLITPNTTEIDIIEVKKVDSSRYRQALQIIL